MCLQNIPNNKIVKEGYPPGGNINCLLKCIIARYFTKNGTNEEKNNLVDDIFSSLINYGTVSIFTKDSPFTVNKVMQATAIVELHHIKELTNPDDKNDVEEVDCAVIHYIACNPNHLGIFDNMYIVALLKEIVSILKANKPKIKTLYIVTESKRYQVLELDLHFEKFGFEPTTLVEVDKQVVHFATMNDTFYNKLDLFPTSQNDIGYVEFLLMNPEHYNYVMIKEYKDNIAVTAHHEHLGVRNMDNFESMLLNRPLIQKIKDAIKTVETTDETEITIKNYRAGATSSSSTERACSWKAAIALVELYHCDKAERMKSSLSFDPSIYNDLLFFGSESNSLHYLLKDFDLKFKRPTYPNNHVKKGQKVRKAEYKSFVMNAKEGLFICLLKNSDLASTHAVGIDARTKTLFDPDTSNDEMPLNDETLKKCCNGLNCVGFEVVGMIS